MPGRAKAAARPDVFAYEDYRRFLKDLYRYEKGRGPLFSYGLIAKRAGLSSRSHPKLVMDGKRNLSGASVARFAEAMRLSAEEAEFFRILTEHAQARSPAAKEAARKVVLRARTARRMTDIPFRAAAAFLKSWANFLVLGLTRAEDFRADPLWISRRLQGRITPAQAAGALRCLSDGGFIRAKGTRLISTTAGSVNLAHQETHAVDMESLLGHLRSQATNADRRHMEHSTTLAASAVLTREDASALKRRLREWILENIPISRQRAKGELCVFVADLYPLSGPLPFSGRKTPPGSSRRNLPSR